MHQHTLPNGKILYHAHPYHKSNTEDPGKPHTHNELEFFFIEKLDLLFFSVFTGVLFIAIVKFISFFLESEDLLIEKHIKLFLGRAPPALQS